MPQVASQVWPWNFLSEQEIVLTTKLLGTAHISHQRCTIKNYRYDGSVKDENTMQEAKRFSSLVTGAVIWKGEGMAWPVLFWLAFGVIQWLLNVKECPWRWEYRSGILPSSWTLFQASALFFVQWPLLTLPASTGRAQISPGCGS